MKNKLLEKPIKIAENHYLLKILTQNVNFKPGHFINIKINKQNDPLLRRPFSIYDFNNNILEIVIQIVGTGTTFLRDFANQGVIDILGPLGNGFTLTSNQNVLLVGGGVGNAPLYFLAKELKNQNCNISYIYGSRNKDFIYQHEQFKKITDNLIITTDDGSIGQKGFVTDAVKTLLNTDKIDKIYICGPTPMMEAMIKVISPTKISCEVSLENYFGCGIGLCSGCTVQTTNGQKKACIDGPVFDGYTIIWDKIAD